MHGVWRVIRVWRMHRVRRMYWMRSRRRHWNRRWDWRRNRNRNRSRSRSRSRCRCRCRCRSRSRSRGRGGCRGRSRRRRRARRRRGCWRWGRAGTRRGAGCGGRCGARLGGRRRVVAVGGRRVIVARRRGRCRCRRGMRIAVIPAQRAGAAVGRPAARDFLVDPGEPVVARGADTYQCLAARKVVAAADECLHAGAADHRLYARPDGALRDHQVHFCADHTVAIGDVDCATADHRTRMPRAVEHDDDARVARLLVISVCGSRRDRKRCADTHANQQRGPRNAVHEALTHDDLPARWPYPSVRGLAHGARLRRVC